jgi:hypothetical protein
MSCVATGRLVNAEGSREADLRFTTYRLQVVERMPPSPGKDALLLAIYHRLVTLGLPVQVHGAVSLGLITAGVLSNATAGKMQ